MLIECGCDEAGRGAGAAEVYAGAVILDPNRPIKGLMDSKKLSPARRTELSLEIKDKALAWGIGTASLEEISDLNILQATLIAMKRAVEALGITPDKVYVDGNQAPPLSVPVETIVKGDDKVPAISAASILAKVARDEIMMEYHGIYPQYRFDVHKGYFTKEHMEALRVHGPCPIHRHTFGPIKVLLGSNGGAP